MNDWCRFKSYQGHVIYKLGVIGSTIVSKTICSGSNPLVCAILENGVIGNTQDFESWIISSSLVSPAIHIGT